MTEKTSRGSAARLLLIVLLLCIGAVGLVVFTVSRAGGRDRGSPRASADGENAARNAIQDRQRLALEQEWARDRAKVIEQVTAALDVEDWTVARLTAERYLPVAGAELEQLHQRAVAGSRRSEAERQRRAREILESKVKDTIAGGIVGKIDAATSTVYVNEFTWATMNIDAKRGLGVLMSEYLGAQLVRFASYQSGKRLGRYSAAGGLHVE